MRKRSMRAMFAAALALTLMLLGAAPALAHEGRKLGDLEMEVGWGTEPAYSGEVNSVQILLVHDGKPVVDLGDTLDVEVTFGDQTQTFSLEPFFEEGEFGTPGDYRAWLIPTTPGQYSFHFTGTIDGEDVDETFTSGPKTFDDVQNPQSVEFPVQQPSTGELAERIDRVETHLERRGTREDIHLTCCEVVLNTRRLCGRKLGRMLLDRHADRCDVAV